MNKYLIKYFKHNKFIFYYQNHNKFLKINPNIMVINYKNHLIKFLIHHNSSINFFFLNFILKENHSFIYTIALNFYIYL